VTAVPALRTSGHPHNRLGLNEPGSRNFFRTAPCFEPASCNGPTVGGQSGALQIALQVAPRATPPNWRYPASRAANIAA
jgi:hypothetical protein